MEPSISQYLLGQGVLGFTTLILAMVVVFLYREMKNSNERHEISLLAERKLNADLQEQRLTELRNALAAVVKSTESIDAATKTLDVVTALLQSKRMIAS